MSVRYRRYGGSLDSVNEILELCVTSQVKRLGYVIDS